MEKKDFLDQFTDDSKASGAKPSSFKEEEMTKVVKDKKPLDPKWIIIPLAAIIVIGIAVYFIFLKPSIIMQNFVGLTKTDVANFVKQQGINADGVVIKEEYSLEFDQDQIISQDVPEGTKIGKDAKLTFVASKGADPEEHIDFPTNLKEMTKDQIEEWISINKLSKTRITTVYDAVIEEGKVISYDLKNTDPKDFKRGSILQIKISKGPQPPAQVTVEDFKGKDFETAQTWAKSKKVNIAKKEEFSDTLALGLIISQSAVAGSTIAEGSTLTVTVSKGKGIVIPDFANMTRAQVDKWLTDNAGIVTVKEKYSSSDKYIVEQSVESGKKISADEKLEVVKSLGKWYLLETEFGSNKIVGRTITDMSDACNNVRNKGIDAYVGEWQTEGVRQWSDTYSKDTIVSAKCADSKGNVVSCDGHLPLDTRFDVVCSKGLKKSFSDQDLGGKDGDGKYDTQKVIDALAKYSIPFNLTTKNNKCTITWESTGEVQPASGGFIWFEGITKITLKD